jgi:succinoglycan biosynthesis transport protein ExoP
MLHVPESRVAKTITDSVDENDGIELIDLDRLLSALRRQAKLIIGGATAGLILGLAYVVSAVPLYTASADILIDKGTSKFVDELSTASGVFEDDADMLSQVELLKSDRISRAVVDKLKLTEDAGFMAGNPSLLGYTIGSARAVVNYWVDRYFPTLLAANEVSSSDDKILKKALKILEHNLDVSRVDRTYVINLTYTSGDPSLAARIANAYGDAYLDDQLQAKYDATRRASGWLQDRIAELKQQSYNADLAVQKFRAAHGLIAAGGQLVSDQQLSEINSQLTEARASTAQAKARLDQIEQIIKSGQTDAVVNDALVSTTINKLREEYLDASQREAEIEKKLGPDHIQAIRLRQQMDEYRRLMFEELGRIAQSYSNDYKVALSRQRSLEESLTHMMGVTASADETEVQLRQLERESDTFKSLYDNFLQRYQQTVQQQSFPITDARVITIATPPEKPSFPKKPLVLALFGVLGLAASSGLAAFREYRDRFFRSGDQVRTELQAEFLGFTPIVSGKSKPDKLRAAEHLPGDALWRPNTAAAYVRFHPLSPFAETLRNIKVAADLGLSDRKSKVLGVVSCLPSEGKTTIASNLSVLLAMQGARSLLIDGDLRNPGLTRTLEMKPNEGLIETLVEGLPPDQALRWDSSGRMGILPTVLKRRISHTSEILASLGMAQLLEHFRSKFDYIVVDLPPLGPIVDAKAFANRIDAFVLIVEWGHTSRQLVRTMMASNPFIREKLLGVVLNKSDESRMKYYRSYGSVDYYSSQYQKYYHA